METIDLVNVVLDGIDGTIDFSTMIQDGVRIWRGGLDVVRVKRSQLYEAQRDFISDQVPPIDQSSTLTHQHHRRTDRPAGDRDHIGILDAVIDGIEANVLQVSTFVSTEERR